MNEKTIIENVTMNFFVGIGITERFLFLKRKPIAF